MTGRSKHAIAFLILILMVAGLWYVGVKTSYDAALIAERLQQIPLLYRGIGYIVLYVAVTFFLLFSKDVFWVAGALYFGAAVSTVLISVAEVINCGILFFLSRSLGRGFVHKRMERKYEHLDERLGTIGLAWLFVLRAAPVIPYRFLDMAAGLTSIPFGRYLLAVVLGTPLKTFFIQYVLAALDVSALKDPARVYAFMSGNRPVLLGGIVYLALMVLALVKIKMTLGKRST